MSEYSDSSIPILALGKNYYGETLLIKSQDTIVSENLLGFCKHHSLNIYYKADVAIVTSLSIENDQNGNEYIFGGHAFSEKYGLILGAADIKRAMCDISALKESCGEYHLVIVESKGIEFRADYFGFQPLFYYRSASNRKEVICTSYHMLLLFLKVVGERIKINIPHTIDIISEKWTFTSALSVEIENCVCNKTYEYYAIVQDKISIEHTSALDSLYGTCDYSEKLYEDLLFKAKSEIVNNVKMVFEYSSFDNVVVDLSGGLDTRMVLAACTTLPKSLIRPKIKISTRHSGTPNDVQTAALVNSLYDYPYFNNPVIGKKVPISINSGTLLYANNISKSLGTYKDWGSWPLNESYLATNIASLYGGCGDLYHGFEMQHLWQINNYIENRNRFHFRQPFRNSYPVLMSKSAAKLSQVFRQHHGYGLWKKVSIDLLTLINPLLATLPFANQALINFFSNSENITKLYNFPVVSTTPCRKIKMEDYVRIIPGDALPGNVIYDEKNIRYICDYMRNYSKDFEPVITGQLSTVLKQPKGTILYRWWSLFFVLEILQGRGDFYGESNHSPARPGAVRP